MGDESPATSQAGEGWVSSYHPKSSREVTNPKRGEMGVWHRVNPFLQGDKASTPQQHCCASGVCFILVISQKVDIHSHIPNIRKRSANRIPLANTL